MGSGGQSEFGDDSYIEKVMANVLRKPFTTTELSNLISEGLQGRDAFALQAHMKAEYETFAQRKLQAEVECQQ